MNAWTKLDTREIPITVGGIPFNAGPGPVEYVVETLEGWWGSPGVRGNVTPRLWAHGDFAEKAWRTGRIINVAGRVYADTTGGIVEAQDKVAAILGEGDMGLFTVLDPWAGEARNARVKLAPGTQVNVDWDLPGSFRYQFTLHAPDGRKYGQYSEYTTKAARAGGGLEFPLFQQATPVMDFGEPGIPGTVTVTNTGKAPTAPVFKVTGELLNFSIVEQGTASRLYYKDPIPAGHYVMLDAADGSVQMDGYADRSASLSRREWTLIQPGQSATYLFESPGAVGSEMTLGMAPAWW